MFLSGSYNQLATYWAPEGVDGYGKLSFDDPILLMVRWEDRDDLIITSQDEQIPSKAVVYTQQSVALGGYLALGDYTDPGIDPETLDEAHIIRMYKESPSVSISSDVMRKATL